MTTFSEQPGRTSRERIDALLDESLMESFPASDSSAIGSGIAAIKEERRAHDAAHKPTPPPDVGKRTVSGGSATL